MILPAARLRAWLPLWPAMLVIAVYLPALNASFQFDDWRVVVADPRVASLGAWWHSMPGMRALLKLSYALNHTLDAGPAGYRAVNIALHALNASLVFVLLRRLARRLRAADEAGAVFLAGTAALIFALHPVQTESVTYVSGRSNLLMGSWVLLALLAYTYRRGERRPWFTQLLALVYLGAALASKETAAVAPLAMLLLVCREHGQRLGGALWSATPALLLVLALLLAGILWLPYDYLLITSLATRDPLTNLAVQVHGIGWLVGQLVRIDLLNADPALSGEPQATLSAWCTGAALVGVLLVGLWSLKRRPALAFGILWFYLWLAPTNSLLARLDVANDRQLYLALIGPAWLAGLALLHLPEWLRQFLPNAAAGLVLIVGVGLAAGTLTRNRVYATEVSFWEDVQAKSPWNARAANNLGMAHALACQPLAARAAFERALRLAPQDSRAPINLALLEQGELPGQPPDPRCR